MNLGKRCFSFFAIVAIIGFSVQSWAEGHLKTGEKYWEHDVGKTLYSSPTYADGKIFMMDNDGVMRVYEFGKEMKLISENKLGEKAGTTAAFANGKIYIRGDKNLYCIGK